MQFNQIKFIDPNTNLYSYYLPNLHIPTITKLLKQPLLTLDTNKTTLKNHFTSNNTVEEVTNYLLFDYKYAQPLNLNNHNQSHFEPQITNQTVPQCTIDILRHYEDIYNIKYVIIDKSLGIGIIDKPLFTKLCKDEINKIWIIINYPHNPAIIRDKATEFAHKHQHTLHSKYKSPNQSFFDSLDDIHHTTNGYFLWNPIYKAHKTDSNGIHVPKIRPVIFSN